MTDMTDLERATRNAELLGMTLDEYAAMIVATLCAALRDKLAEIEAEAELAAAHREAA